MKIEIVEQPRSAWRCSPLETLPRDCQERITDLTERRAHAATMSFTRDDADELSAWERYLEELAA